MELFRGFIAILILLTFKLKGDSDQRGTVFNILCSSKHYINMKNIKFKGREILRFVFILVCVFSFLDAYNQSEYFHRMDPELRSFPITTIHAVYTEVPPLLDGKLDDACWQSANEYNGFQLTKVISGQLPENQTKVYILYDERFLYFGFECLETDMNGLRTKAFIPDDRENMPGDDRVELLIDLEHNHSSLINLMLNASGAMLDQRVKRPVQYAKSAIIDVDWNGKWHANVHHYEDKWTAEIFVDIRHMTSEPISNGNTFGLLLGRVRSDRSDRTLDKNTYDLAASAEYSSFPYATDEVQRSISGFFEPIHHADLIMGDVPVIVKAVSFNEAFANYNGSIWHKPQLWGDNPLEIRVHNQMESPLNLKVIVESSGFSGVPKKLTNKVQIEGNIVSAINALIPIREDGFQNFNILLEDAATGESYYSASYTTRVPPFIEFDLEAVYLPQELSGKIKFTPIITDNPFENLSVKLALFSKRNKTVIATDYIREFNTMEGFSSCFNNLVISDLVDGDYKIVCELIEKGDEPVAYYEQLFTRKSYDDKRSFGVREGMYSFAGIEDHAVIVEFPDRKDFVFAAHGNYIPWWDMNNVGLTYEFVECWGFGYGSCCEPMQDKQNLYTNVEVLEESSARVVIRYQYALNNNNFRIFFNEWVDEYYTIYPDGTGTRRVELWANTNLSHEIIQPQYVMPPGILPTAILEDVVGKVFNLQGDTAVNLLGSQEGGLDYSVDWTEEILRMPLKNRKDPFLVIGKNEDLMPGLRFSSLLYQTRSRDIRYNLGGHWPLTNLNVDVYSIVSTNKAYHSWIGNLQAMSEKSKIPNVYTHLFGATDKDDEYLKDVASSWLKPGNVKNIRGGIEFLNFNQYENAYEFVFPNEKDFIDIEFSLHSAGRKNIVNPVLLLHNCPNESPLEIYINNKKIMESDYRYSWIGKSGEESLLIWINKDLNDQNRIRVKYARK